MTRAYDISYLNDAKETLGLFFDYLINDCGMEPDFAASVFVSSGFAEQFGRGNPVVIAGMSGIEMAEEVIKSSYRAGDAPPRVWREGHTAEYWAGWALAYYQWFSGRTFRDIFDRVRLSEIISMYGVYHEMDVSVFADDLDIKCRVPLPEPRLKKIRENRGLSQAELAKASGVNIRSIQMYEQRVNDIDKAQAQTLYKLARVMGCNIEDILENPMA